MTDEMQVYRVNMRCITQGCLHRCKCSFLTCKTEPDIGSSYYNPCKCLMHQDEGCAWRVESYEEIPGLTAILGRRKGE